MFLHDLYCLLFWSLVFLSSLRFSRVEKWEEKESSTVPVMGYYISDHDENRNRRKAFHDLGNLLPKPVPSSSPSSSFSFSLLEAFTDYFVHIRALR